MRTLNSNEIEDLTDRLKRWKRFFTTTSCSEKDKVKIILREKTSLPHRKYPRRIIISILPNYSQYSIISYEIYNNGQNKEEYKQIYNIEVKGDITGKTIAKELEQIIFGEDESIFHPQDTFRLKFS